MKEGSGMDNKKTAHEILSAVGGFSVDLGGYAKLSWDGKLFSLTFSDDDNSARR